MKSGAMTSSGKKLPAQAALMKDARQALGLDRMQLSYELGLSARTLEEFEQGHAAVRKVVLMAVETLFRRRRLYREADQFQDRCEAI